ncbi:esterase-like activity of phytase family protein [Sphingomonas sp. PB2P12]|uniref:esterase-like activity of phytase family protein n=1 Tax=Sphingomonas sandaracina TaxID=3096157 RepID=UPI002FCA7720
MRRLITVLFVCVSVCAIVPTWSGEARLDLLGKNAQLTVTRVMLDGTDPRHVRVGGLTYLGGVVLDSRDPAFGGFSSLDVARSGTGNRFTLLSDGGNVVRFDMGQDWRPHALAFANLPAGPGIGWEKGDRDSESMVIDPGTGQIWVGFEYRNAIWRYAPGFAGYEARVSPEAMRKWPANGGAESMARMPDGRFVVVSEVAHVRPADWTRSEDERLHTRQALIFASDPTRAGPPQRFAYEPYGHYDPSDATALPNGDLLVLDRGFSLPFRWSNRISRVVASDVAAGRIARGRLIATIDAPLIHDNFEGIDTTVENGKTIVWIVSDDNQMFLQRTLLLKFRFDS